MSIRLSTSIRERSAIETLKLAKKMAHRVGITRVTEVTRLDRVGVPIFVSIRPNSQSLCVNSGKSLLPLEAEVGAYMEAIEFFYAEQFNSFAISDINVGDLTHELGEFCLLDGIDSTAVKSVRCVQFDDPSSPCPTWLPAELAFHPFRDGERPRLYGTSTNGLASGNSIEEATAHALFELLERDCFSFYQIFDDSRNVSEFSLPKYIRSIINAARKEGLETIIKFVPNEFNLPFFVTLIHERSKITPLYTSVGCGLHMDRNIALARSVTEAFQSRLAYIHGGRDDIVQRFKSHETRTIDERISIAERQYKISIERQWIDFGTIPTHEGSKSGKSVMDDVTSVLKKAGFNHVYRLVLTPKSTDLVVVRVVVPYLENYSQDLPRIGPRLTNYYLSSYGK
ncbi:YcaO-like family protein [Paraburkholderia tropica]|uniref:YcaO-like family protein n=1 Tax=Paraburkholderia tropica TaxID=92647 RepID=UPI002285E79F|nr:YcaO-like family protein [Paraburkholderia tropica]